MRMSETGRLVAVAVLSAGLVATAPAAATAIKQVANADKVDGLHAVKAKASPAKRKGKLVATNKKGLLPNDIIAKAPDTELVDGLDSSAFARNGDPLVLNDLDWVVRDGTEYFAGSASTAATRNSVKGEFHLTMGLTSPVLLFGRPARLKSAEICYNAGLLPGDDPVPTVTVAVQANRQDNNVWATTELVAGNNNAPKTACLVLQPPTPYTVKAGYPLFASITTNNVSGTSFLMAGRVTTTWVS